jgi:hypothetical protein
MIDENLLVETLQSIVDKVADTACRVSEIDNDLCSLGLAFGALIEVLSEKGIVDKDTLLNKQEEMSKAMIAEPPTLTRIK